MSSPKSSVGNHSCSVKMRVVQVEWTYPPRGTLLNPSKLIQLIVVRPPYVSVIEALFCSRTVHHRANRRFMWLGPGRGPKAALARAL